MKLIKIREKEFACRSVINELDNYRFSQYIQSRSRKIAYNYCEMICPLQYLIDDYQKGKIDVSKIADRFYVSDNFDIPKTNDIIEVINDMFNQIEKKLHLDFTELLNKFEINTQKLLEKENKENEIRNKRKELILHSDLGDYPEADVFAKIKWLYKLHDFKINSQEYLKLKSEEQIYEDRSITKVLSEILLESMFYDKLSIYLMDVIHNYGILSEDELEELINNNGFEHDYEWYREDLFGCACTDTTVIPVQQLLDKYENKIINDLI